MTAFPSGVTNNVNTSNLDSATDQPKNARADLLTLTQRVNQMINSFNANSGICGLDAQGKVDSAKLIGQIDTSQLAGDAVNGDKIEDDAVDSEHIANGAVDYDHISFGATATDLGGATPANNIVPTQAAVKTYVDAEIAAADTSVPVGNLQLLFQTNTNVNYLHTTTHTGTATQDMFITAQGFYEYESGRPSVAARICQVKITVGSTLVVDLSGHGVNLTGDAWVKKGESYEVLVSNSRLGGGRAYYRTFGFTA